MLAMPSREDNQRQSDEATEMRQNSAPIEPRAQEPTDQHNHHRGKTSEAGERCVTGCSPVLWTSANKLLGPGKKFIPIQVAEKSPLSAFIHYLIDQPRSVHRMIQRRWQLFLVFLLFSHSNLTAAAETSHISLSEALKTQGTVIMFRYALAPDSVIHPISS